MIYILVAVFNRKETTRRFLEALRNQTEKNFRVVLVDDGSTDGTGEMLKKDFPDVHVLHGNGQLWWTGAMRLGIDWIRSHSKPGDFVICANNDQLPKEDAIERLLRSSRAEKNGIVGSVSRDFKDPSKIYDAAFSWNWKKNTYQRVPVFDRGQTSDGVDVLTCRFTIVPIEVFDHITFRPSLFPHYLGDYDFFLEAKRLGYPRILSYDSVVYDVGGPSGIYVLGWRHNLKQLYDNFFSIRSHGNLVFMSRYYFRHCPSVIYKIIYCLRVLAKITLLTVIASGVTIVGAFKGRHGARNGI